MKNILELNNITKTFGDLVANNNITIKIKEGTVHSIVGENGAGKSTLMNIVYGLLKPDKGEIILDGKRVYFNSPLDSIAAGIGMIHQHFMLIPTMTVLDNIILGYESGDIKLDRNKSKKELKPYFKSFGLNEELFGARIGDLSVGIQQKVEIIKALYRKAKIIILDEPTAVLTPQEIEEFFALVKNIKNEGKTIIFISHKLNEIMEISDEISILRAGELIDCVKKEEVNEKILAKLMIGRDLVEQKVTYCENNNNDPIIEVIGLKTPSKLGTTGLKELSFSVNKGEIFGIAGIAGNGQTELVNILVGTQKPIAGKVLINGEDVTNAPAYKRTYSLAYIPEDRQIEGLIMPFDVSENMLLGKVDIPKFIRNRIMLDFNSIRKYTEKAIRDYSIKVSGYQDAVKSLSGGNQQKVIIARELSNNPEIILAVNPTRGIDIGSIEYIHSCIINECQKGKTVLLISNELNEIMSLSHRIGIIHDGKIVKIFKNINLTKEELGYYMLGGKDGREVITS